jgi:glycosyltransferase involved in cell wall biosynthesis
MRTALIVSYAFPPRNIVGAIRPLKFARYLPEFGWRTIVLTVRRGLGWSSGTDLTLVEQLPPETRIVRTCSIEPPYRVVSGLAGGDPRQVPSFRKRLLRALRTVLLIPDDKIGWLPFALLRGWRILRHERVDLIFATSPPPTALLVATLLSRWTCCPLVVDFRDPWTQFALHRWLRNLLRRRIEEAMEHAVVRQASRIITVTSPRTKAMAEKYPHIPASRWFTLTNGFDLDDFGLPVSPPHNDRFTIVYTGSFYYHRQPDGFLKALQQAFRTRPDMRSQVRVFIAGGACPGLAEQISAQELDDVIILQGLVPYVESISLQKTADLLLLFIGASPMASTWYPAKLFEYIATGRPILAIVPEGIAADLVREAGTGMVVHPENVGAICQALLDLHVRWREDRLPTLRDPALPMRFERRHLTERLAALFNTVLAESTTE